MKHEYEFDHYDYKDDDGDYAPSTSYAAPPLSSSSSTPLLHASGGKNLATLSRVTSSAFTPSTFEKSFEALGLETPATSTASTKKRTGKNSNPNQNGRDKDTASGKGKEKLKPDTFKQTWSEKEICLSNCWRRFQRGLGLGGSSSLLLPFPAFCIRLCCSNFTSIFPYIPLMMKLTFDSHC